MAQETLYHALVCWDDDSEIVEFTCPAGWSAMQACERELEGYEPGWVVKQIERVNGGITLVRYT